MDSKEADNTLKDVKESKENAEETGQSVGRSPQIGENIIFFNVRLNVA